MPKIDVFALKPVVSLAKTRTFKDAENGVEITLRLKALNNAQMLAWGGVADKLIRTYITGGEPEFDGEVVPFPAVGGTVIPPADISEPLLRNAAMLEGMQDAPEGEGYSALEFAVMCIGVGAKTWADIIQFVNEVSVGGKDSGPN